jgi:hypothetical protein
MLEALYHLVKAKYDIAVYQWYSPPSVEHSDAAAYPHTPGATDSTGNLAADGWVADPYWLPRDKARRYIQRHLLTGKPFILMPWASDEGIIGGTPRLTHERKLTVLEQLDLAVEFNLPVAFYWTKDRPTGGSSVYFGCERGSNATLIDDINNMVWDHITRVQALDPRYLGAPSADLSVGSPVVTMPKLNPTTHQFVEEFNSAGIIGESQFTGFRNFVSDGTRLDVRGFNGRTVDSTITWTFRTQSPVVAAKATLLMSPSPSGDPSAVVSVEIIGGIGASVICNPMKKTNAVVSDVFSAPVSEFKVKVSVRGASGSDESPLVTLKSLLVTATK